MVMPDKRGFSFQLLQRPEELFLALFQALQVFPLQPVGLFLFVLVVEADAQQRKHDADPNGGSMDKGAEVISLKEHHASGQKDHMQKHDDHQGYRYGQAVGADALLLSPQPAAKKFQQAADGHNRDHDGDHFILHVIGRGMPLHQDIDGRNKDIPYGLHGEQSQIGEDVGLQLFSVKNPQKNLAERCRNRKIDEGRDPGTAEPAHGHGKRIDPPERQHPDPGRLLRLLWRQHHVVAEPVNRSFNGHDELLENKLERTHTGLAPLFSSSGSGDASIRPR